MSRSVFPPHWINEIKHSFSILARRDGNSVL
jgi:hypothetical protein